MVEHLSRRLDTVFGALADPTRRAMLRALADGPSTVGELASPYTISLAAASKHVKVLERAGLVKRTVQGRVHRCELDVRPMHAGLEWMRFYEAWWNRRLGVVEGSQKRDTAPTRSRATKRAATAVAPVKKTGERRRRSP